MINQEHLDEVDIRSMLKGGAIGAGVVFAAGALLWWSSKGDSVAAAAAAAAGPAVWFPRI